MTEQPEVIRPEEQYYIVATSAPAAERALVLKQGDTFAVFDPFGDIDARVRNEEGVYHEGTRFLSHLKLLLANECPLLLSSTVRRDNVLMTVDQTNPDIYRGSEVVLPRGILHIHRSKILWTGVYYEQIRIRNFALTSCRAPIRLEFEADFVDVFEVRGQRRSRRGTLADPVVTANQIALSYTGLDGVVRRTEMVFSAPPTQITPLTVEYLLDLGPIREALIECTFRFEVDSRRPAAISYGDALGHADRAARDLRNEQCTISTSDDLFDAWLQRSQADLNMMLTRTPHGLYPYAGVPWFSAPFGRDGIITALECLWMAPEVAKGVLAYLSATQAIQLSPEQDAEPGKILHEQRDGEMAALNEVPFRQYYGSVDSTPLFVMLAGAYYKRTGDLKFIQSIWKNIELALHWIDRYGDRDGDGFVEYCRRTPQGLVQQGWKDSHDSVFHADGTMAEGPIALCEVQGYVFGAKTSAAALASALGLTDQARKLRRESQSLKDNFDRKFWCKETGLYALALDGQKQQCKVRTSNSGQCLFTGIAGVQRARAIAGVLMGDDCFTGWGIRTVAQSERRYNPMSYHNGSVWPHDNALIAAGFAHYDLSELTAQLLDRFFELSAFLDLNRLPELFCGFDRRPGNAPTLYPVACAPQTWAAAAVFYMLQASVGLSIDALSGRIIFRKPVLPSSLDHVRIRNLGVAGSRMDVVMFRSHNSIALTVEKREGNANVVLFT